MRSSCAGLSGRSRRRTVLRPIVRAPSASRPLREPDRSVLHETSMRARSALAALGLSLLTACGSSPGAKSADDKTPHPLLGKKAPPVSGDAIAGDAPAT